MLSALFVLVVGWSRLGPLTSHSSRTPLFISLVEAARQHVGSGPVALLEDGWYSLSDFVQMHWYWLSQGRPIGAPAGIAPPGAVSTVASDASSVAAAPTAAPRPTSNLIATPSPLPQPTTSPFFAPSPGPQPPASAPVVPQRAMHVPVTHHPSLPPTLTIPASWPAATGEGNWQPPHRPRAGRGTTGSGSATGDGTRHQ